MVKRITEKNIIRNGSFATVKICINHILILVVYLWNVLLGLLYYSSDLKPPSKYFDSCISCTFIIAAAAVIGLL
jgi:hypothetical protein